MAAIADAIADYFANLHPAGMGILALLIGAFAYCETHTRMFGFKKETRLQELKRIREDAIRFYTSDLPGQDIVGAFDRILDQSPEVLKEAQISSAPRRLVLFNLAVVVLVIIINPYLEIYQEAKSLQGILWIVFLVVLPFMLMALVSLNRYLVEMGRLKKDAFTEKDVKIDVSTRPEAD